MEVTLDNSNTNIWMERKKASYLAVSSLGRGHALLGRL